MTLEETGREYLRQSCEIFRLAEKVEDKMKTANGGDLCRLRLEHEKLTDIAGDMKITGENLVHYYDR